MSKPQPPSIDQVYREFQMAHTTESNVIELLYKTTAEQQKEIVQLRARVMELSTPKKKK
jgi:hypothetical protein